MRKSPFLAARLPWIFFIIFLTGVSVGNNFPFKLSLSACLISLIVAYLFFKKNNNLYSDILLSLFFFFAATFYAGGVPLKNNVHSFLDKPAVYYLKVISLPRERKNKNIAFVRIERINNKPYNIKVKVFDFSKKLKYRHNYLVRGTLRKRVWGEREYFSLWIKKTAPAKLYPSTFADKFVNRTTNYFLSLFKKYLSENSFRFLASVFLGRRELLLPGEKNAFKNTGLMHLLAISGLHLSITSLAVFFILRFFNVSYKFSLIFSTLLLYFYTFLTGGSSSTIRAVIMQSVFVAGFLLKRKVNLFNSLGLAGIICLLLDPASSLKPGFQLSFLSVFAIIFAFNFFPLRFSRLVILRYFQGILFCSFWVSLFITPVISFYFGKIYFLSILYNVFLIPHFTFILIVNFIFSLLSWGSFFASSLSAVLDLSIRFFEAIITTLANFKFSYLNFKFSACGLIFYYLSLTAIVVLLKRQKIKKAFQDI